MFSLIREDLSLRSMISCSFEIIIYSMDVSLAAVEVLSLLTKLHLIMWFDSRDLGRPQLSSQRLQS